MYRCELCSGGIGRCAGIENDEVDSSNALHFPVAVQFNRIVVSTIVEVVETKLDATPKRGEKIELVRVGRRDARKNICTNKRMEWARSVYRLNWKIFCRIVSTDDSFNFISLYGSTILNSNNNYVFPHTVPVFARPVDFNKSHNRTLYTCYFWVATRERESNAETRKKKLLNENAVNVCCSNCGLLLIIGAHKLAQMNFKFLQCDND